MKKFPKPKIHRWAIRQFAKRRAPKNPNHNSNVNPLLEGFISGKVLSESFFPDGNFMGVSLVSI